MHSKNAEEMFNNAKNLILSQQSRYFQLDIYVLPGAVKNLVLSLSRAQS